MRGPLWVLVALGAVACSGPPEPPEVRSCRGEPVLECDPYEWAVATAASFDPPAVPIADPRVRPTVVVELETCGATTPSAPTVQIYAVFRETDAGEPGRAISLATVRAASATDTRIEATIDNPFTLSIPPETDVTLRFLPVVGGCDGEAFELPYRTGPTLTP